MTPLFLGLLILGAVVVVGVVTWVLLDAFWLNQVINKKSKKMVITSAKLGAARVGARTASKVEMNLLTECQTGEALLDAQVTEMVDAKLATDADTARTLTYCDISAKNDRVDFVGADGKLEFLGEVRSGEQVKATVWAPRGADDIIVELDDISGDMYSMFIVDRDHPLQAGFSASSGLNEAKAAIMLDAQKNGHKIVGQKAVHTPSDHPDKAPYTFSAKNGTTLEMQRVPKDVDLSHLNTTERQQGALHMALESIVYSFYMGEKVPANIRHIRVLLCKTGNTGLMGVKQVQKDGKWMYLDKSTNTLVEGEPAIAWSFWNQNEDSSALTGMQEQIAAQQSSLETAPEEQKESILQFIEELELALVEAEAEIASRVVEELAFKNLFNNHRAGMPIGVVLGDDMDFNHFKDKNVTMDLVTSGYVGFRNAKIEYTVETLRDDHIALLKLFDINDLSLKAEFTFADE